LKFLSLASDKYLGHKEEIIVSGIQALGSYMTNFYADTFGGLTGCNNCSSREAPLDQPAAPIEENDSIPVDTTVISSWGPAASLSLNILECESTNSLSSVTASQPLSEAERNMAQQLSNEIINKINARLSLNNIISDIRGASPAVLRGAQQYLVSRNEEESFLSNCQLNILLSALDRAANESQQIIPPVYLDAASILVNQNGYATGSPISFVVAVPRLECSPEPMAISDYQLTLTNLENGASQTLFLAVTDISTNTLAGHEAAFLRFELPALEAGRYQLSFSAENLASVCNEFEVRSDLYVPAIDLASHFFQVQRAHSERFHGGLYADDPVNVGGHLDAGDNNIYLYTEAPTMLSLVYAYQISSDRRFLEEAEYGARFLAGLIRNDGSMWSALFNGYPPYPPSTETDGVPNTGDERPLKENLWGPTQWAEASAAALFARCAFYRIGESEDYLYNAQRVGERLMENYASDIYSGDLGNNLQGFGALISYNLTLYRMTGAENHLLRIENLTSQILAAQTQAGYFANNGQVAFQDYVPHLFVESLFELSQFYREQEMTEAAITIEASLLSLANHLLSLADPIYGQGRFLISDQNAGQRISASVPLQPWMTGTHRGANSYILSSANVFAIAYQLSGEQRYLQAAQHQMDWLFGVNPFGISMFTGIGENAQEYHARLRWDHVYQEVRPVEAAGGAVLGGVTNGIGERNGLPHYDLNPFPEEPPSWQTTENWIPHVGWFTLSASRLSTIHTLNRINR